MWRWSGFHTRKGPSLVALRRGRYQALLSSFFYPVGPLVSDLGANAKKALDEFKAFEVSVSARERFKSMLRSGLFAVRANNYASRVLPL